MSVVLDRPVVKEKLTVADVPVVLRPRIPVEPVRRPTVDVPVYTPAPSRVRQDVGVKVAKYLGLKTALFGVIFGMTYVASTLAGQYLVEQSRAQSMDALSRSKAAVQAEKAIQRRLDVLRSAPAIEEWALSHGFRPADGLGETSKVQDSGATNK